MHYYKSGTSFMKCSYYYYSYMCGLIFVILACNLVSSSYSIFEDAAKDQKHPEFPAEFVFASKESELTEGKRQYEIMQKESQNPRYGECWKRAVTDLHEGCKHLSEDTQSRLAIRFATCFLQQSGQEAFNDCDLNQPIKYCLQNVEGNKFSSYLQFFTHTQSICMFLQSQVWQENTELTINKLSESSVNAARKIEEANINQNAILKLQEQSLSKQEKLLEYGENLGDVLQKSKDQMSEMLREQRLIVAQIFDQVSKLQTLVIGEFAGFYTLIFFLFALLVSCLLTSTPRTNGARLWLFAISVLDAVIEIILTRYSTEEETAQKTLLSAEGPIYQRVWLCRKITCSMGVLILIRQAFCYKDYNILNFRLLSEIWEQNLQLKSYLESRGTSSASSNGDLQAGATAVNTNNIDSDFYSDDDENTRANRITAQFLVPSPLPVSEEEEPVIIEKLPRMRRKKRSDSMSSKDSSLSSRYNLRSRSSTPTPSRLHISIEDEPASTIHDY